MIGANIIKVVSRNAETTFNQKAYYSCVFNSDNKFLHPRTTTAKKQYVGLNEYTDMAFLLHFLREDDLFIDIGANVGSYTVLASAHIGAQTFSFEPVPSTFTHLIDNIAINRIEHKVAAHNMALGAEPGTISFTQSLGTVNHVALENEADTIQTPIETLDNVLGGQRVPALLKIDVEGFETEVIRGATQTLKQDELKAIIIELNGFGARYGYDEHNIHKTLLDLAFSPFQYNPKERALIPIDTFGTHNTIYIRDFDGYSGAN